MRSRGNRRNPARPVVRCATIIATTCVTIAASGVVAPDGAAATGAAAPGAASVVAPNDAAATGAAELTAVTVSRQVIPLLSPAGEPAEGGSALVIRYGFEQRGGRIIDESGRGHRITWVTSDGGTTRFVSHDAGRAVAFPRTCGGDRCPRAVLQVPHAADLNPGRSPFGYGAAVKLARHQTSTGQNVLQKGYSAAGSQYKLQIDGFAGMPSCVVVDRSRSGIRRTVGSRTVADGEWHRIECRRSRHTLTVVVDGVVRGRTGVPATLTVANGQPVSIGGKGAFPDNDQFQGALDDVWVSVG